MSVDTATELKLCVHQISGPFLQFENVYMHLRIITLKLDTNKIESKSQIMRIVDAFQEKIGGK